MSVVLAPAPQPDGRLRSRLIEAVRPEFTGPLIRVATDDPVFGRGVCRAAGCPRPAWTRLLCQGHYLRWRRDGRPDITVFAESTGPIAGSARGQRVFDLGGLPEQAGYEVGFILQCRHDDRSVRLLPATVRQLIKLLAAADVASLLDRPLAFWLDAIAAKRPFPERIVGLVRYGYHGCSTSRKEPTPRPSSAETSGAPRRSVWPCPPALAGSCSPD